jgi:large subunit ribosomal protein L21
MKTAVIKTGGKQYVVQEGDRLKVDRLAAAVGKTVKFEEILLTATDKVTSLGKPLVKGAKVEAEVIVHARHRKVVGVKMKPKKRYRRYFGHKQPYTEVQIIKIQDVRSKQTPNPK